MSLISEIIPEQGFEKTRDVIGAILTTELSNQKVLQGFSDEIKVFTNRTNPFQQSEKLMINVLTDSANYSNNHEKGAHGNTNFFIDIYTSEKETSNEDGGYLSAKKRDKFLGMVKFILQDHHYKTLNLPVGLIMGTYVEGFDNYEPNNQQDAAFVAMSRLSFSVRIVENQTLWEGVQISSIFTKVKLDLTDKGYQYQTIIN